MKFQPSLRQRISFGFLLLVGLMLISSGLGLWYSRQVEDAVTVTQNSLNQFEQAVLLGSAWSEVTGIADKMLLTRQTGGQVETDLNTGKAAFSATLNELKTTENDTAAHETTIVALESIGEQLLLEVGNVTAAARSGQWARAQVIRHTEMASLQRRFDNTLQLFTETAKQEVDDAVLRMNQMQEFLNTTWSLAAVATFITAGFVLVWSIRSVTGPIARLTEQARELTAGNYAPIHPLQRADELGELSRAFAQMNDRVRESYHALEERVAERTQALETSIQISRSLSTILDPDRLVREVVVQISNMFNYHATHIYLLTAGRSELMSAANIGENGRQLSPQPEPVKLGIGTVGRAAADNQMLLNPEMIASAGDPPTAAQSEAAIPIAIGNDVLGVLHVQHQDAHAISAEDARLLQAVAGQLAIALRNARAYTRAQELARREALVNNITQRIQTAADVDAVLQIAAQELGQVLRVKETAVHIGQFPRDDRSPNGHKAAPNPTLDNA